MKKSLLLFVVVILISAFSHVFAQDAPRQGPPKVLYIVREDIKPGLMGAHNKHSASFANIFRTLDTPNHRIALVPVAGSENEVIYITGTESFKQLEDILDQTDKKMASVSGNMRAELDRLEKEAPALHAGMRDMMTMFRPDLSYNPGVDIRTMRYFSITTVRVRPGHETQYNEHVQKMIKVGEKAKIDDLHLAAFQVISGAQAGTYMFFRPMKSLEGFMVMVPLGMRMRAAMGDDMSKDADKTVSEAVLSSETSTYSYAPSMSYVEKDFAAGDPAFWNPKPAMVEKPKAKKGVGRRVAQKPPTD